MEFNEIKSFVSTIKNCGEFGSKIITLTTPTWATINNPYVVTIKEGRKVVSRTERVKKLTYYNGGVLIGGYYINQIGKQLSVVGSDIKEWVASPMSGTEWENYPFIMHGIKNTEQKYLRITLRHNAPKPKVVYFLDGKLVTDKNIIADIKSYSKVSSFKAKQADMGIEEENMVRPLNVKVENILYLAHDTEIGDKSLIDTYFK